MSGFDPNYRYLAGAVERLLRCFTDVWSAMCEPFINEHYMSTAGGSYEPTWSYLIPVFGVGFAFCAIALAKKITFMLIERRD